MNKKNFDNVDGILLFDKDLDISSNHALQRVKRLFNAKKAGHTGSLDPLATGMLPICFGEATKFSQYLLDSDKYYSVVAELGKRTNTGDAEGEVIFSQENVSVTHAELQTTLDKFSGEIKQIPPMFSAIKFQGQPLYKLARNGVTVERKSRDVFIHALNLTNFSENYFSIDVHCSKGTYIRTLVDDIGMLLGCGAYVKELRRTGVAPYQNHPMLSLQELEAIHNEHGRAGIKAHLLSSETTLAHLPAIYLTSAAAFYMKMGQAVMAPQHRVQGIVRMYDQSEIFLGLGEMLEDGKVAPKRLLAS